MRLRWITVCLILLIFAQIPANAATFYYDGELHEHSETVRLMVNGNEMNLDVPPLIIQNRTLVPVRGLFEQLGASVEWNPSQRTVTVVLNDTKVILTVGSVQAEVSGGMQTMDVPAKIVNDRTMIPLRFVSEQLGFDVDWDAETATVTVGANVSYTVARISYNSDNRRITVTADQPITGVTDSVMNQNRIVVDFQDAKIAEGNDKIQLENSVLKEIRWSQYRINPYIGRLVVESEGTLSYRITYSEDRKQMYLDFTNAEEWNTPPQNNGGTTQKPSSSDTVLNEAAKQLLVVIDPGHGGTDVGAIGRNNATETYEKDVNLAIALKANRLLQAAGVNTYMTRETDVAVELTMRPVIANQLNADLFLSVHNNAFSSSSAHGTTVLYYPDGQPDDDVPMTSYRFAEILQEELVNALGRYDRGLTDGREMAVIRGTVAPAVITEIAFITNPEEQALLTTEEFQERAAQALCTAVIRALNEMTS